MGNDIRQIYSKLMAIKSESERRKSETLEQYQDRLSKIDQCDLGPNLRCNSKLAFYERMVLDPKYDADSQTMAITFSLNDESLYSVSRKKMGEYIVLEIADNTVSERYVVRNGAGDSIDVLRTKGQTWALSIVASELEPIITKINDRYYECTLNFKMPTDSVQEFNDGILKDIGFLYVGTLEENPAYEDKDQGSAMVGWAYSKDVTRYALKFKLDEIWIVNKATGRVYGKYMVGGGENG